MQASSPGSSQGEMIWEGKNVICVMGDKHIYELRLSAHQASTEFLVLLHVGNPKFYLASGPPGYITNVL